MLAEPFPDSMEYIQKLMNERGEFRLIGYNEFKTMKNSYILEILLQINENSKRKIVYIKNILSRIDKDDYETVIITDLGGLDSMLEKIILEGNWDAVRRLSIIRSSRRYQFRYSNDIGKSYHLVKKIRRYNP